MRFPRAWIAGSLVLALIGLSVVALASSGADLRGAERLRAERRELRPFTRQGTGDDPVIAAAGDIAQEGQPSDANEQTADLILDLAPTAVLTLGDNQYDNGELSQFMDSYDLTWGQFKNITYPAPGNHDYHVEGAQGYFDYFGDAANPPDGYYSFDLGTWHLIAVNSGEGSISDDQLAWIRRDIRSDDHRCELAYWHHPRWSSGDTHGSDEDMAPLWRLLYRNGVDVVLNGHDHLYERFAGLNGSGELDRQGIREIIAGTGGNSLYDFGDRETGSRVRISEYGVLTMVLHDASYEWEFLRAEDGRSLDDGRTACHS
jgi:hypothetical protein